MALVSGKFTAAEIKESMKDTSSQEQRINNLKAMMTEREVFTESADSFYSEKADALIEQIMKSGKVDKFQIIEATKNCTTEQSRCEALESLRIAKKIDVARITRNNGTSGISEAARQELTRDEKIARAAKENRMTLREASVFCGFGDPGAEVISESTTSKIVAQWKRYSPAISDSQARQLAERGVYPG